jgi:Flp pilus assembly protein TadG
MLLPRKRFLANDDGQTLVEFALISVMLVMLLLAVFEIGRMMLVYTTVANATRAGARYWIVHGSDNPATTTDIQTVVKNLLSAAPLDPTRATISVPTPACNNPGCVITVTTTYPYDPLIGYYSWATINLSSTSEGVITF